MGSTSAMPALNPTSGSGCPAQGWAQIDSFELSAGFSLGARSDNSAHTRAARNPLRYGRLSYAKRLGRLHLVTEVINKLLNLVGHVSHH